MRIALVFAALVALAIANVAARTVGDKETDTRLTDNRIVGGQVVDITLRPYQISLRYKSKLYPSFSYEHDCGGAIYSDKVVITAAHCVIGKVASEFQVVAGTNNRVGADGVIVPVKTIVMHDHYNPDIYQNDIAFLILATPLPLNNFTIQPIALRETPVRDGAISLITGWGKTTQGGDGSDKLLEVRVPIISSAACNEDYQGGIDDSMLCAGQRGVGGKDACQGDSGGPLVVDGQLTGVVSWGKGCAQPNYPGVYANVSHLRPWLLKKLAEYELNLD